jgi:hypothetical protein
MPDSSWDEVREEIFLSMVHCNMILLPTYFDWFVCLIIIKGSRKGCTYKNTIQQSDYNIPNRSLNLLVAPFQCPTTQLDFGSIEPQSGSIDPKSSQFPAP